MMAEQQSIDSIVDSSSSNNNNSNNNNSNIISDNQELLDILNSLADTFINESNYSSFEDLFMSVEEAYWYYIDIHLIQNPRLPKPDLEHFAEMILQSNERLLPLHQALLFTSNYQSMIKKFEKFKRLIPKYGAIIMNKTMDKVVLVKEQWWGWGFPKGKGKEGETEAQSAAREVFEEIGFNITMYIKKEAFIQKETHGVIKKFFIVVGVDEMTDFETHTRYEISRIKWHNIEDIPLFHSRSSHQFAAIIPYIKPLLIWIDNKRVENGLDPIHRNTLNNDGSLGGNISGGDQFSVNKWTSNRNKSKQQQKQQQQTKTIEDENEITLLNEIDGIQLSLYIDEFKKFLGEKQSLSNSGNNTPKLNSSISKKIESINLSKSSQQIQTQQEQQLQQQLGQKLQQQQQPFQSFNQQNNSNSNSNNNSNNNNSNNNNNNNNSNNSYLLQMQFQNQQNQQNQQNFIHNPQQPFQNQMFNQNQNFIQNQNQFPQQQFYQQTFNNNNNNNSNNR